MQKERTVQALKEAIEQELVSIRVVKETTAGYHYVYMGTHAEVDAKRLENLLSEIAYFEREYG